MEHLSLYNKTLEIAQMLNNIEHMADRYYKVTMWFIRRYKNQLFKEFDLDPACSFNEIYLIDKIHTEMQKEMPEPWWFYCCILGKKDED